LKLFLHPSSNPSANVTDFYLEIIPKIMTVAHYLCCFH
jgi:hypothetical protein